MDNKFCKYCGREFTPAKNDVRLVYCSKECRLADRKNSEYNKKYYHANKERFAEERKTEKYREMRKRYNERRREKYKNDEEYRNEIKEKVHDYNSSHPEQRLAQRVRKYGLTAEEYKQLIDKQGGKCAICGANIGNAEGDRLYVDHDHATGKVRGLLCTNCNLGLGKFQDSVQLLQKAILYLGDKNGINDHMV